MRNKELYEDNKMKENLQKLINEIKEQIESLQTQVDNLEDDTNTTFSIGTIVKGGKKIDGNTGLFGRIGVIIDIERENSNGPLFLVNWFDYDKDKVCTYKHKEYDNIWGSYNPNTELTKVGHIKDFVGLIE